MKIGEFELKSLKCLTGYFGERFAEMARRYGGDVAISRVPYGTVTVPFFFASDSKFD